jgi:hypothetical protein
MRKLLAVFTVLLASGAASATAAVTPPQNTSPPTISGVPRQGEILTADPGTWTGTQPITFAYQWRRCDSNGGSCSNIIGATSKTYALTSVDVGNTLRVRVSASNDAGTRSETTVPTSVIAAKPAASASVSLDASRSSVIYGGAVLLSGSVSNGQSGQSVTITERRVPSGRISQVREVATLTTRSSGDFSVTVRPPIHAVYTARIGATRSDSVSVNVRPRIRLTRLAGHRYLLRAMAVRSFVGKYGLLQRWNRRAQVWVSVRRVYLTRSTVGLSPTVVSRRVFRAQLGRVSIRVLMPLSQTVPGYISGTSNVSSS